MKSLFAILSVFLSWQTASATTFYLPTPTSRVVGHNLIVYSNYEDTLLDIARRFDIGYKEISAANPEVDVWLPGDQQEVFIPNQFILPDAPHEGIVINLAEMRLFYYPKAKAGERQTVITHPIGIGREGWETPLGKTRITEKKKDPTWTPTASILKEHEEKGDPLPKVVPAGPENPLGAYAMRLGIPGYLLHGTNKPFGVGMRVSHGCIRLYPEDIEHLFGQVAVNTPVLLVYQPYKAAWENGRLYLEAHQEHNGRVEVDSTVVRKSMVDAIVGSVPHTFSEEDWAFINRVAEQAHGYVQVLHTPRIAEIHHVWFLHAGLAEDVRSRVMPALEKLKLTEQFWPLKDPAKGEVLIGPFDSQVMAEEMATEVTRLTGLPIWTVFVSEDAL